MGPSREALIAVEFPEHILMILKAFPLEYEGSKAGNEKQLERRQRAMRRHYQSLLSVAPLSSDFDWMWRSYDEDVEPDRGELAN